MKSRLLAVCALALLACPAHADFAGRLAAEIDRVGASLESVDPNTVHEQLRPLVQAYRERLAETRRIESPLLRLYRFRGAYLGAEIFTYMGEHKEAAGSLDAFEKLWKAEAPRFADLRAAGSTPLQRALTETAANRAEKVYRASLAYAKVDTPHSGLYYLAEAEANRRFGAFVASLPVAAIGDANPDANKVRAAADALEAETLAFFGKDRANREAIAVSARLKEARELLDRGSLHGAQLGLAETRLELVRRSADPKAAGPADDAQLAQWLTASALPAPAGKRDKAPVTVSLVRWPYT